MHVHAPPVQGVVGRQELVDIQNKKLDDFHLKDTIDRMNQVRGMGWDGRRKQAPCGM